MTPLARAYQGLPVFVTGHTGFKGGWLCTWLKLLGARVSGFALPPADGAPFFRAARVAEGMRSTFGDVRDLEGLAAAARRSQPRLVFHLAGQPLVRRSYREPVETFSTNVLGTVHLLEALRGVRSVRAVVVVTSDKCYENPEDGRPRTETDPMGGHDPYSASKGAAELAASAYYRSYFKSRGVAVACARAGNVIGGGDWAEDRIVPDAIRALASGRPVRVRNPGAIRPWQHVLEPVSGYLWLGARLLSDPSCSGGWNFGPAPAERLAVGALVRAILAAWGAPSGRYLEAPRAKAPHEAATLVLDPSKARRRLGWRPAWGVAEAVRATVAWYRASREPGFDGAAVTRAHILEYASSAARADLAWAGGRPRTAPRAGSTPQRSGRRPRTA